MYKTSEKPGATVIIHTHLLDFLHALKIAHLVKYAGTVRTEIQEVYISMGWQ